jgi:hypothetical protein
MASVQQCGDMASLHMRETAGWHVAMWHVAAYGMWRYGSVACPVCGDNGD